MDDQRLYRELVTWLRAHHPRVLAQWESERSRLVGQKDSAQRRLQAPAGRPESSLDRLSSDADVTEITRAIQRELEMLGIGGGTPGVTQDGAPCIHLIKQGVYGSAYEESVTLARIRDPGYRRHLKQVFG
jgi:hypothetical protein